MATTPKRWVTPKKRFHFDEFYVSSKHPVIAQSLANFETEDCKGIMRLGVEAILDPLREEVGAPVRITSGYRSHTLNKEVGGSVNSDHLFYCAVDIVVDGLSSAELAMCIVEMGLPYRQLVFYEDLPHVHVSWNIPGRTYKHEVLCK